MTENRYKTILGGTGLAYLKNDQPVDVETRNVRSEKRKEWMIPLSKQQNSWRCVGANTLTTPMTCGHATNPRGYFQLFLCL